MKKTLLFIGLISMIFSAEAQQKGKRIWLSGQARNVLFFDQYSSPADSISPARQNSGHTMVDLAANIQPNKNTFIHGMVRVRNDYGGFWSGGVTFDVRQLYLKGVLANAIRYQIGDINYKMTPYTLRNPEHDLEGTMLNYTDVYQEILDYDLFYDFQNSWRQQGAAVDFGLEFKKFIKEVQFNGFISRQNPSNFSTINERLYGGGNITAVQSKYLSVGVNYINMFDLLGTATDSMALLNPVITSTYELKYEKDKYKASLFGELGNSSWTMRNDTNSPQFNDFFYDLGLKALWKPMGLELTARYKNVGARFFSPGAQTRRLDYSSVPLSYSRYGNDQTARSIGFLDLLRDGSIYNTTLNTGLGAFNPAYGNASPYGDATPNRQGFVVGLNQKDKKKRWDVNAQLSSLSQITGEGTSSLKSYMDMRARANLYLDKFIGSWKKQIKLSAAFWMESTDRASNLEFEQVNLDNQSIDVALDIEVMKNGFILGSYRMLSSVGNDYLASRNGYQEVLNYTRFDNNLTETMYMIGGRYEFSKKSSVSILWTDYDMNHQDGVTTSFGMNSVAILYNLKF